MLQGSMNTTVPELLPILQSSIGPVILISGVGLLLLTLTNRFGRTVSEKPLRRRIPTGDDAIQRLADDGVVGGLDNCGQP